MVSCHVFIGRAPKYPLKISLKKRLKDWRYSSVAQHLPGKDKVIDSTPSMGKKEVNLASVLWVHCNKIARIHTETQNGDG